MGWNFQPGRDDLEWMGKDPCDDRERGQCGRRGDGTMAPVLEGGKELREGEYGEL
jgi:hypothetical protein